VPPWDACDDAPSPPQDPSPLPACTGPGLSYPRTMLHRGLATGPWERQPDHTRLGQDRRPTQGAWASAPGNDPGLFHPALEATLRAAAGEDHLGAATALLSGAVLSVVLWVAAVQVVPTLL